MKGRTLCISIVSGISLMRLVVVAQSAHEPVSQSEPSVRAGVSAGLGVSYVHPQDIVDVVNSTPGVTERSPQFKSAVEFFFSAEYPVSDKWLIKAEYAYDLGTYNLSSPFGPAQFSFWLHMPSLIAEYVLVNEGVYNVKLGAGAGYHVGYLSEKFATIDAQYTGNGPGLVADLEATTAFGEHLYAYLGGNLRWELVGELKSATGASPGVNAAGEGATLHLFGVGARLGFTYYF